MCASESVPRLPVIHSEDAADLSRDSLHLGPLLEGPKKDPWRRVVKRSGGARSTTWCEPAGNAAGTSHTRLLEVYVELYTQQKTG